MALLPRPCSSRSPSLPLPSALRGIAPGAATPGPFGDLWSIPGNPGCDNCAFGGSYLERRAGMIPLSMAEGAACFQFKSGVNAESGSS